MSKPDTSPSFAMIGIGGFIADRHLKAIKENNGQLVAAMDITDSVGRIDAHFPKARFFTQFELFDAHVQSLRRADRPIDYISICSPNYLHDSHIQFALRSGATAICEKPLVLDPASIDTLQSLERASGRRIATILQLRLHPKIIELRDQIAASPQGAMHDVDLTYITSRGQWYYTSWKGQEAKSGGIATNIGVHFYDMLSFVFGPLKRNVVHHRAMDCAAGYLEYEKAKVRWFLSINVADVPATAGPTQRTYRSITVDGNEIEFSEGFTDLHTHSYREIMAGRGFSLADVRPSIETVAHIRHAPIDRATGAVHPFVDRVLAQTGRYHDGYPA
jgi:UDP-N-acetyl-2-amino-2-deoxyglucuronate dehydrogenase